MRACPRTARSYAANVGLPDRQLSIHWYSTPRVAAAFLGPRYLEAKFWKHDFDSPVV